MSDSETLNSEDLQFVQESMQESMSEAAPSDPKEEPPARRADESQPDMVSQLAAEVIDGMHGTGARRREALGKFYDEVIAEVRRIRAQY